jgi:hypothetical protein
MDSGVDVTVKASGAETSSTNGAAIELDDVSDARLDLVITAVSGTTPTLDVAIQTSADGSTGWTTIASFAQQTATTTGVHKIFGPCDRYIRYSSTIGGTTPSFTYSITGEAV